MSKRFKKLSHTIYECKYHFTICPKYRFRIFKDEIAEYAKQQTYFLCRQKELVEILEMNVQVGHIHMVMSIPPKYSISSVMGFLKGKLSLRLFQRYAKMAKTFLRGIRVNSKDELKQRILKWIEELNESPVVFRWKWRLNTI
jgi:putative transposase